MAVLTAPEIKAPGVCPVPIETVTPMKVSEAIRLGSLTTRQGFGHLAHGGYACALGAAMVGMGIQPSVFLLIGFQKMIGMARRGERQFCPDDVCQKHGKRYGVDYGHERRPLEQITHLNDRHRWSRERIADWLESQGL